ncbi:MAG: hypothetical protein GXP55_05410 [Deltaproteobacteria bacterium]|nr:hypothetical protein [Deltaproteobacteria bacterium]
MANRGDGSGANSDTTGKKRISCSIIALVLVAGGICVVPVLGVVAAVAIPAFINFTKRSKTSEAGPNLRMMYEGAATYYMAEHVSRDGSVLRHCTVDPATTPATPTNGRVSLSGRWPESFVAIDMTPPDPLYFQYAIVGAPSRCGVGPDEAVYTFQAHGDLDADGVLSTFEYSVESNSSNELYRSVGLYVVNELE